MAVTTATLTFIRQVLGLFSKSEVKTPLSFAFRFMRWFGLIFGAVLLTPGLTAEERYSMIVLTGFILLVPFAIVFLFAWKRPHNLVYGETAHRAERKLEYGTERGVKDANRIAEIPSIENLQARSLETEKLPLETEGDS